MKRHWMTGLCLLALGASVAPAGEPQPACLNAEPVKGAPRWHPWRLREWPGKQPVGTGGGPHTFERAGYPNEVSKCARPSETPNYSGYYVGGGSPWAGKGGHGPAADDGTWGWDYTCFHGLKYRVKLFWNNRYQGGGGAYKIDGPPVTDVGPYIAELKHEPPGARAVHKIQEKKHGEHEHE